MNDDSSLIQIHALKALAVRGFKNYVESPAAYVVLFVFYLLTGYLFALPLFLAGEASIRGMQDFVPLLLTFLVPALAMGLLAEELRSGTFETLATLPLEDWDIVLGKYLGFCAFYLLVMAGLLFYPVVLSFMVQPPSHLDWGQTLGILCSFSCLGLMYGAIGLFASSINKNQIVALVTAFLICFALFLFGKLDNFFSGPLATVVAFIGSDSHIAAMSKGVFDTRDIVYFASVIFIFLHLTVQRLQSRRF
ncbi:MAG: ABC transporter permease subunit [Elusimicrobiota bacterium]